MNKRKILVVVPYRARDLEDHALVGHYLERRYGHDVIYSNGYGITRKLMRHAPDALVLDHLGWNFKLDEARFARRLGMKVIVLPTEGLFLDDATVEREAAKLNRVHNLVDLYLAWGDRLRNAVVGRGPMESRQIQTVGCSRCDFFAEPFLGAAESRESFYRRWNLNPGGPIVLWATNTTYFSRDPKKIISRYVKKGNTTEKEVREFLAAESAQFHEGSRVVLDLASQHRDWNLLIKIHPAEQIRPYMALAKRAPNVHLAYNAPIRDFLVHCGVLLQRNCTTAIEAWMLGKPVIQLEIGEYSFRPEALYQTGCHMVYTVEEARWAAEQYIAGASVPAAQRAARETFTRGIFHEIDGRSAERCAAAIDSAVTSPAHADAEHERVIEAAQVERARWEVREDRRPINRLKDALHIPRESSLRWWKRLPRRDSMGNLGLYVAEPEITQEMVNDHYRRFDSVLSAAEQIRTA